MRLMRNRVGSTLSPRFPNPHEDIFFRARPEGAGGEMWEMARENPEPSASKASHRRGKFGKAQRVMPNQRVINVSPSTSTSILVRRKQSIASSALHTTGSFSLKLVLSTAGTPVMSRNAEISAQ